MQQNSWDLISIELVKFVLLDIIGINQVWRSQTMIYLYSFTGGVNRKGVSYNYAEILVPLTIRKRMNICMFQNFSNLF